MRRPMMYAAIFFAAFILILFHLGVFDAAGFSVLDHEVGETINITAKIVSKETKNSKSIEGSNRDITTMKVHIETVNGTKAGKNEKLLVKYYGSTKYIPGQYVMIAGKPEIPESRQNPGCFDYALYLRSIGITYVFNAEYIELCINENGRCLDNISCILQSRLYDLRERFLSQVGKYAGKETSGMMRAIMFGSKTGIDEDVLEEFQKNGTAHVLAVSGLHVGLIYGFISALWIWKKGRLFFSLVIVFFMAYMVMASFSPSIVRAVIMVWIHVFAVLTNRRYDMASAAFFTAILMLAANPMHLFNTGFQMSFLAVLTLSLMMPIIKKIYSGIFFASLAIQFGLLPYTIYVFNYVSLAAVLVNVPVVYLTGLIVPMGMISMAVMLISDPLSAVMIRVLSGLCTIMTEMNDVTAIDGITVLDVVSPPLWVVVLYYLVLLVFVSEDGRLLFMRKRYPLIKRLVVFILVISMVFGAVAGNHFTKSNIVFVDVGQGDCMHIRVGREDYLVDGGGSLNYNIGKKILKPYLLKNGAKSVDGAFVTHLHTDHYKGIAELCRDGMVEKLYVYEGYRAKEGEILEETGLEPENIIYLYAGQKVNLSNDVFVEILWPPKHSLREYEKMNEKEEDENQFSLIMKVNINEHTMLATGDVDSECLDTIADKYGESLDIDILKVAHHGSKYSDSESFADAAKPDYAVFQVGKNNFGHPNEGIVEKFHRKGIIIYRNDLDGAVAFDFGKNGKIKVKTVKGE